MDAESKGVGNISKACKVIETKKKALTKNELMAAYRVLEEKYENLLGENKKNVEKIEVLKLQLQTPTICENQETQTMAEFVEISCREFIFVA